MTTMLTYDRQDVSVSSFASMNLIKADERDDSVHSSIVDHQGLYIL
jgi:hypothetical protein